MPTSTSVLEQEEVDPHHSGNHREGLSGDREYLLVCDLPQRVRALQLGGLKVPEIDDDLFGSIKEQMVHRFEGIMPVGTRLRVIEMQQLSDRILGRGQEIVSDLDHGFIVSTCTEIAQPAHGMTLEINRLADTKGNVIGIGSRPGYPALENQVNAVLKAAAGRPLIFIEDGTFTGSTMQQIISQFRSRHAKIGAVVLGFAFPESRARLETVMPLKDVHTIEEVNQPVDWVPDHDFFPLIPNCGRVIGVTFNGAVHPFYNFDGVSFSVPYLTSFCPMAQWTGLKTQPSELLRMTYFFLENTIKIFERLEELNQREIAFADLKHARPRVCIPYSVGGGFYDTANDPWVLSYLRTVITEID